MMREYSITTLAGSCTPQNTAEPSMAGVKKGRPAMTSMTRNQRATAPAPIRPAMNPSRRIRVSCIDPLPWKAPECEYGGTGYSPARPHDPVPTARVPAVSARRLAARRRGGRPPSRYRRPGRRGSARRAWPAIHWAFLFSFPLALTGLVGVIRMHAGTAGESAVRAAILVATLAYALWAII